VMATDPNEPNSVACKVCYPLHPITLGKTGDRGTISGQALREREETSWVIGLCGPLDTVAVTTDLCHSVDIRELFI